MAAGVAHEINPRRGLAVYWAATDVATQGWLVVSTRISPSG